MTSPRPRSWLDPRLEVRDSAVHGRGIFAREAIPRGVRVAIFGGDVMRIDEIEDLPEAAHQAPMQIEERFVLGSRDGRLEPADFFNHSCEPNAGLKGQLFLVALRNIEAGEEICFDYAMVVSESVGSDVVFTMSCHCGGARCRREITESDWQLPELQRRYHGYFSQYLQERIDSAGDEAGGEARAVGSRGRRRD